MKINGYEPMQQLPTQRPAQPSAQTNPTASQQQLQDDRVTLSSGKTDGIQPMLGSSGGHLPPPPALQATDSSDVIDPLVHSGGGKLPPPPPLN